MPRAWKAAILLIGGFASLVLIDRAYSQVQGPRFSYGSGSQGIGYYATRTTAQRSAASTTSRTTASTRGRTVGPGVRDWSTGRRGRLAKPWLRAMD